ncbi:hypothetical protein BBP00_00008530 [Phytophthora kernoviae]|uniref:Sugar transporter SWEET1 n=1 Tax=Phytophthora kernoviae TaxID=325452 RepID=A0A3F2RF45_9STRA|nr:hypothetical protein BBP00_00008530 [Phytophthora kernoviae]
MSGHDVAVIVARVLTLITTIMMRLSLLPDFNRWRKNQSTGDMSVMPSVLLYTNCYALLFYAYVIDDMLPLFVTSVLGVIAGGLLAFFFYRWTDNKRQVIKIFIGSFIVCLLVTTYATLAMTGVTGQSNSSQGSTLGCITLTTTVGLYASPMTTIARVIRTKTSSSMPFTMGVVNVINSFCWGFYASLVGNWFILAPNIVGFTLGSIQLTLTFIYPNKPQANGQVISPGANAIATIVFQVLTIITTILMRISLLPDFNRWRKNKTTGDMSVLPSVMIFGNSYGGLFYAIAIDNWLPLFATSILGVVVGILLTVFFYHWAPNKPAVIKIFIGTFVVCVIITTYNVLALAGVTGQSDSSVSTTLGFIMIAATCLMYASPMTTITRVIKTKTPSSMPFTMGVVNVMNSFCWGVYGYLINNMFLLAPNIVGVTLSVIQMVVTYIYRSKPSKDDQVASLTSDYLQDQGELNVVILSPKQGDYEDIGAKDYCKSPSFVVLHSPSRGRRN